MNRSTKLRKAFAVAVATTSVAFGALALKANSDYLLTLSASEGYRSPIAPLLQLGVSDAARDRALAVAVLARHPDVAEALLDSGARDDGAGLLVAAIQGDASTVKLLLDYGADVNLLQGGPLLCAAANGHSELVHLLLNRGADPSLQDWIAVKEAEKNGYADVAATIKAHASVVSKSDHHPKPDGLS